MSNSTRSLIWLAGGPPSDVERWPMIGEDLVVKVVNRQFRLVSLVDPSLATGFLRELSNVRGFVASCRASGRPWPGELLVSRASAGSSFTLRTFLSVSGRSRIMCCGSSRVRCFFMYWDGIICVLGMMVLNGVYVFEFDCVVERMILCDGCVVSQGDNV